MKFLIIGFVLLSLVTSFLIWYLFFNIPEQRIESRLVQTVDIVGAGPVGLLCAYLLHVNGKTVRIFEKHPTYQRDHPILLQPLFLKRHMSTFDFDEDMMKCKTIKDVEVYLKSKVEEFDIPIIYQKVNEAQQFNADLVIGCDGANSIIRKRMNATRSGKSYQTVLQVRCDKPIRCKTKYMKFKMGQYYRFIVPQIVWQENPNTNFKNETLIKDLNGRISRELKCIGHLKCSIFKLDIYKSDKLYDKDQKMVLCGDSAFGVPFFKSLQNGLLCAISLAENVDNLSKYLKYTEQLWKRERLKSDVKGLGLKVANKSYQISSIGKIV